MKEPAAELQKRIEELGFSSFKELVKAYGFRDFDHFIAVGEDYAKSLIDITKPCDKVLE